jgi:hypothetical protein
MKSVTFAAVIMILVGVVSGCGAQKKEIRWVKGPMPASGNFDGVYQSDFGRLELTAQGNKVVGLYESDVYSCRIEGELDDNLLFFKWTQWNSEVRGKVRETRGEGVFQYIVEEVPMANKTKEYHRLEGWWGYSDGDLVNRWNANKYSGRSQKRLKPFEPEKSEMEQEEDSYETGFDDTPAAGGDKPAEPEEEGSMDDIF